LQKQPARGKGIHDLPQFYIYMTEIIQQIFKNANWEAMTTRREKFSQFIERYCLVP